MAMATLLLPPSVPRSSIVVPSHRKRDNPFVGPSKEPVTCPEALMAKPEKSAAQRAQVLHRRAVPQEGMSGLHRSCRQQPVTCPESLMAVPPLPEPPQRAEVLHRACRPTGRREPSMSAVMASPVTCPAALMAKPAKPPPSVPMSSIVVPSHRKA